MADTAVFYSHNYSLRMRLQAQDRIETLKRSRPIMQVDIVAEDTVDEQITQAHAGKRAIQDYLLGRPRSEWL